MVKRKTDCGSRSCVTSPINLGRLCSCWKRRWFCWIEAGATTTARKLSGLRELSEATRDYFMALSFELEEKQTSISPLTISRLVEVESDDIGYQALRPSLSFMAAWDSESVRAIANVLAQSVG